MSVAAAIVGAAPPLYGLAVLALPLLAVALAVPAPGCSLATARAEIRRVHLALPLAGPSPVPISPSQADATICFDFTGDGRRDLAVTIASGGTAGDVGWVVFVRTASGYRLALKRSGYKLGLARLAADLVETDPVYRKNDPNCCPTGGFDHTRWRWRGGRFVAVRSWHDASYRP